MVIEEIEQVGNGCPTAWNIVDDSERKIYVRYRWGVLSVTAEEVGKNNEDYCIFSQKIGGSFDGFIDWDKVEPIIKLIDVELEIKIAIADAEFYKENFANDQTYRREQWRKGIQEMNDYILEMRAVDEEAEKNGKKNRILSTDNPPVIYTPEQIETMLDQYEIDHQRKLKK